ncbi:hypothetical protein [Mangrovimonas sp. DI 80]|uniref:hypothetical protein n=1 Tax=Mangrovimonas sp. DI 80 TaxID=1779330 RepID=UPI000977D452|nr:hypothetical protein [Mangrovimonas sp. DI 80]OMP30068.1 hypothetical protein BKM32_14415 [Mangrovimonas sp. DI 80]
MPECIVCGEYTKFNGGHCYDCYKKENNGKEVKLKDNAIIEDADDFNFDGGLDDKQWNYRYNMIKGRIAETLIQELFLSLGFNVFRYGMENTIPGIMELLKGVKSDVATEIRRMPDFVVQNPNTNEVFFVEVKFRKSGMFALKDLPKDYPYRNAYIILVSKKHIRCITVDELEEGKEITPTSKNYLGSRKEFELNKQVIIDFCNFAVKFFEGVE